MAKEEKCICESCYYDEWPGGCGLSIEPTNNVCGFYEARWKTALRNSLIWVVCIGAFAGIMAVITSIDGC